MGSNGCPLGTPSHSPRVTPERPLPVSFLRWPQGPCDLTPRIAKERVFRGHWKSPAVPLLGWTSGLRLPRQLSFRMAPGSVNCGCAHMHARVHTHTHRGPGGSLIDNNSLWVVLGQQLCPQTEPGARTARRGSFGTQIPSRSQEQGAHRTQQGFGGPPVCSLNSC